MTQAPKVCIPLFRPLHVLTDRCMHEGEFLLTSCGQFGGWCATADPSCERCAMIAQNAGVLDVGTLACAL